MSRKVKPFMRWVGGKRNIAPRILEFIPDHINDYYEPFMGGGAVWLAVKYHRKIYNCSYLSDINSELVNCWQVVKLFPERLISQVKHHRAKHCRDYHSYMRSNQCLADIEAEITLSSDRMLARASRFMYLNRTNFKGLWRMNGSGELNAACGPWVPVDYDNLLNFSQLIRENCHIFKRDFAMFTPAKGDLVYCDPPYDGTYDLYTQSGFGVDDLVRLRDKAIEWTECGAGVILSNSDTEQVREVFDGWPIVALQKYHSLTGKGNALANELLIIDNDTFKKTRSNRWNLKGTQSSMPLDVEKRL